MMTSLKVAACHLSPVILSARATTQKCINAINRAARNEADLVVFPETFIPAFPVWSALLPPTENHEFFKRMTAQSVLVDGEEVDAIRNAASKNRTLVSLGISERVHYSSGTLFNSNLIIGADGRILVHHRKLVPTFFEKLTWSPGDGNGLRVAETPLGRIGALICGENTNPLARYALMAQGEQVHISTFPAAWPTRKPPPYSTTAASIEPASSEPRNLSSTTSREHVRNYDNVAANRIRAAAHCFEAKCFGIVCSGYLDKDAVEEIAVSSAEPQYVRQAFQNSPRAATMFLDPTGSPKEGYVIKSDTGEQSNMFVLQEEEDILYATMDLSETIEGKQFHDVVGGYQRLDVFDFRVNRTRRLPATFHGDSSTVDMN